ncbi:MAG: hypothetical protein IKN55_12780 [Oscillospiraceae bacterium]|nr:hypothetical protein [Oscillospiraceae bacterium]
MHRWRSPQDWAASLRIGGGKKIDCTIRWNAEELRGSSFSCDVLTSVAMRLA